MLKLEDIKRLRELTSLGINECKKALQDAQGDFEKALKMLKERGTQIKEAKRDKPTLQGLVEAYVHFNGGLGAMVEVNCETDFVARTEVFRRFAKDLAMHIAAANPKHLRREDISQECLNKIENLDDYAKENCLLEQSFVKNDALTIEEYLQQVISQTGERIVIKRFARFSLGE